MERETVSEPFPIDWHLAGVAFSCISQSKSPCRYHRRVAATKLTTSDALLSYVQDIIFILFCKVYHPAEAVAENVFC